MFKVYYYVLLVLVVEYGNLSTEHLKPTVKDTTGAHEYNSTRRENEEEMEFESKYNFPEFDKVASFLEPIVKQVEGEMCMKQLKTYIEGLRNSSLWAVQMFDASAKLPQGSLTSDAYDLGNYDGCIDINLNRNKDDNIFGKYCLATMTIIKENFDKRTRHVFDDVFMDPQMSTWENFMEPVFRYGFMNGIYRAAICVPDKCTPKDVESMYLYLYNNVFRKFKGSINITVSENVCSTKNTKESTIGIVIVRTIVGLFLCVTTSTILDLLGWCNNSFMIYIQIPKILSAYRNFKYVTSSSHSEHIPAVDCLRGYALLTLVMIRRLSFFLNEPLINRQIVNQVFGEPLKEIFFNINSVIADTFILVHGFLHFQKVERYLQENPKLKIKRVYVVEFLKAIPLQILTILFYSYVFETIGNGPMWKERTENSVRNCKDNWVANFLRFNNFFKVDNMCVFESWYFSVIAHCFVTVPFVARLMQRSSAVGLTTLGLLTTTALVFPIVLAHYKSELRAISKAEIRQIQWDQKIQTGTCDRALSYFIGIWSYLTYTKIKDRQWRISKVRIKVYTFIASAFCCIIFSKSFLFYSGQSSHFFNSIINKITQLLWGFFISWIIIGVSTKKLPALTPFFTQGYLYPLSRLIYPYLLIVGSIQLYTTGTMRTVNYLSPLRLVWMSAADLLATYVFAFVFYMIIHKPISIVLKEKILMENKEHVENCQKTKTRKCKEKIN